MESGQPARGISGAYRTGAPVFSRQHLLAAREGGVQQNLTATLDRSAGQLRWPAKSPRFFFAAQDHTNVRIYVGAPGVPARTVTAPRGLGRLWRNRGRQGAGRRLRRSGQRTGPLVGPGRSAGEGAPHHRSEPPDAALGAGEAGGRPVDGAGGLPIEGLYVHPLKTGSQPTVDPPGARRALRGRHQPRPPVL